MKKLLLLSTLILTLMSVSESVQAQCAITSAKVSANDSCIFTTWAAPGLGSFVTSIEVNGKIFWLTNPSTTSREATYSLLNDSLNLADCDTTGSTDLYGSISFTFFNNTDTCDFQGG